MADVEQQQGGPSTARRKKHAGKSKAQPSNDWPRSGEPRSRASPRPKSQGDIDIDLVESSDDAKASPRKQQQQQQQQQRRRRRPQHPSATASDSASDATAPAKAPLRSPKGRSKSMRVPNASVPVLDTAPAHRRPTCTIEESDDDDDENAAPSGPSRPVSRQTIARREISPRSAHRYRSTPESRRSPRTSVSDSENDTDATSDSEEQVIHPRGKHLPAVPMAPAVPSAPPTPAIHNSLQERLSRRPEMVYEDEDEDGISRYAPSVARHRSLSRPASSRQDHYRRPRDITVSGPPSLDETRRRSRSRSKSARPSRRHYESDVYVPSRPASSFNKRAHATSAYSLSSSAKRSTFFSGDYATPAVRPSHLEKPAERTTVCVLCRDDTVPVSRTAKLKCCHRMCHSCLHNLFKLSLSDPQEYMPPRCCTTDNISIEAVDKLFDSNFKREWSQKYREHTGRNRILCPSRRCGELLKPEDMRREGARWQGRCSRCRTKVCGSCGGRWHIQPECPRDDEAAQFPEPAKREPLQRCYRCKTTVEVKDGRSHTLCRCGADCCSVCGGKWKTCECSVAKYDPFEADDAMNSRLNPFAARAPSPRDFQSDFAPRAAVAAARPRPSSYEEDAHIRRLHDRHDDHLARRMHSIDAFGHHSGSHADFDQRRGEDYDAFDDEPREPRDRRRRAEPRDYGAPFVDDDYHRRAATVVAPSPPQAHAPAAPPPPRSAFEPPSRPGFDRSASGFDYGSASHRNRGMRYTSPDRYDGYMTENYTPERRRPRSPDPWPPFSQEQRPRSRDRRHTFPSESRPTSPEAWQPPTRYPSPERAMPGPEERRRAPSPDQRRRALSPDRRRASSLERRLAGRFKKESRQNPTAPTVPVGAVGLAGAVGPLGSAGALGPISPARAPPTVSRAATHIGTSMPMAPPPPPAPHGASPATPSLRRHHTMDEDVYAPSGMHPPGMHPGNMHPGNMHPPGMHPGGMPPPADWFGPPLPHGPPMPHGHPHGHPHAHPMPGMGMGMMHLGHPGGGGMHDDMSSNNNNMMDMNINSGSHRAPNVRRRPPQGAHREHSKYDVPRSSVLAGLGGMGRGMHRVTEWVNYIEPGLPDGDFAPTVIQQ
ncbi:putative E3 ubiquitin-protein ligase ARI4 [Chaetomidium leptoderma]|uniref:E3 ubiquitin-protein ligase ARI4 n=1 Tax=Chaetomidium leptoderma TaxID=669021 RepID=A0AAN6VSM8_9PEZI|nr:putative E3 ubiquitin-protein ligase ARI4 [Chaetomidium leptoderma]